MHAFLGHSPALSPGDSLFLCVFTIEGSEGGIKEERSENVG